MFSMMSWLPATNGSVILAMVVACLLPMVFAYIAKFLGGFKGEDNQHPRVFLSNLTGVAGRAHAVQQNSYETLPVFLASVVIGLLFFVPLTAIAQLAWLYVVLRVIYGLAYIGNWATFRSIIWALSLACPMLLFYLAVRLS